MDQTSYYIWLSQQRQGHDISEFDAEQIKKKAEQQGMHIIHIESPVFPDKLRLISKPPLVLYCKGDMAILEKLAKGETDSVAVVGTRRASPYGKWAAAEICKAIAKHGGIHISGMAEGIDSAGHRAVLKAGGMSIAVLGTSVNVCYPKSSEDVYKELLEKGLVISEYCPDNYGSKINFPERNRIISGLCDKCVIVEGALRSGSLITARIAIEQGKDLFGVPGNINQPGSKGPNLLIEDGAIPIANPDEIAETLGLI